MARCMKRFCACSKTNGRRMGAAYGPGRDGRRRGSHQGRGVEGQPQQCGSCRFLQALFGHLGVDPAKGTALAHAIVDWHSAGAAPRPAGPRPTRNRGGWSDPCRGKPAVRQPRRGWAGGWDDARAAGPDEAILVDLQEGDVFNSDDAADPRFDGATGPGGDRLASRLDGPDYARHDKKATATGTRGHSFTREAVVRLRAEASLDQAPYQILTWDTPSE